MVDLIRIFLKAGDGGDGRISFHSNRYQLRGGPDGGNGGNGGSIVVTADRNMHSLRDFAGKTEIKADNGVMGGAAKMFGKHADDLIVKVPQGTTVWKVTDQFVPKEPKHMYTYDVEGARREWLLNPRRTRPTASGKIVAKVLPITEEDHELVKVINTHHQSYTVEWVGEVLDDGDTLRVVRGGRGGRGNFEFRSSTHTTPKEAETGETGEAGTYFFELQVLADVGFVGFPNAGKSTLLSVITTARPTIANYPFTTLEPNLGILDFASHKEGERATFVIADIPGIIEGAGEGKGLGTAFLRHIERCRVLLFVLSLEDYEVLEHADDPGFLAERLYEQYTQLLEELSEYEAGLELTDKDKHRVPMLSKKRLVVVNKADLYPEGLQNTIISHAGKTLDYPLFISAKGGTNIEKLKNEMRTLLSV